MASLRVGGSISTTALRNAMLVAMCWMLACATRFAGFEEAPDSTLTPSAAAESSASPKSTRNKNRSASSRSGRAGADDERDAPPPEDEDDSDDDVDDDVDDDEGDDGSEDRSSRARARDGASASPSRASRGEGEAGDTPSLAEECEEPRVSYSSPCHDLPDPCQLNSGWDGDEFCWPAPAAGEGIQIHIGPDDYSDPDEVARYVIEPGSEFNNSVLGHVPLTGERWYNRSMVRMRPGSHHWIATLVAGKPAEGFYPEADSNCGSEQVLSSFGGGQNLIYDNPPGGKAAPENEGVGARLRGDSSLCVNLHAYNFTQQPQLREMWINIYFVDEADVTQQTETIGVVAGLGLSVPPFASQTLTYRRTFGASGRIVQLFGHRHVWTPRFAVWLNDRLVYDSWSWQESVTFNYDSITTNPAPMPENRSDGAVSGPLEVQAGDELTFSCFIENDSDRTLTWRNELREGEMCNLWGATVGRGTGLSGSLR